MSTERSQRFTLWAEPDSTRDSVLANVLDFLPRLPRDKSWQISVAQHHRKRTSKQNKALWGLAYKTIGETLGYDRADLEQLHEDLLCEFFGFDERGVLGHTRRIPKNRSSKLKTVDFAAFFDFVQRKAAEYGVFIPDPDPLRDYDDGTP